MSTDALPFAQTVPAPAPAPVAEVVRLHPDGIFIRCEGGRHWVERRRNSRSSACVSYTLDELRELLPRLEAYLEGRT